MTTPHKWAEVIKAWADGKEVQWRYIKHPNHCGLGQWHTYSPKYGTVYSHPAKSFNYENAEWRIKPETKKYRVALLGFPDAPHRCVLVNDEDMMRSWEKEKCFVRWLTDWIEYEV